MRLPKYSNDKRCKVKYLIAAYKLLVEKWITDSSINFITRISIECKGMKFDL